MNALTVRGSTDWLRSRHAQAATARRQADHYRRLAEIWDAQAAEFEADIAGVETSALHPAPPTRNPAEAKKDQP